MKCCDTLVCFLGFSLVIALSARSRAADAGESRPQYRFLRYDEDYSFLADPSKRIDLLDSVKYIPLGSAGYLSFGGEARLRFESYENEFFRTSPNADNAYLLQRYLFHADYHPTSWLRIFGQLQSSLESGRTGGPRPIDRDTIDLHQLFADLVGHVGKNEQLTFRVGRQEMAYGSGRLIAPREGPNVRRAFDEVRVLYKQPAMSVDAFFASPVEIDPEPFNDDNIHGTYFWGVYATMPFRPLPGIRADFYYLGLIDPNVRFAQGAPIPGREECHTIGARFFGTLGHWDINDEIMYQFGDFESGDVSAWSIATDHGYTFTGCSGQPRLGLRVAVASGDDSASDNDLQTFNPLFVRGDYFTEAGLLSPQNFIDVFPSLRLKFTPKWSAELGCDIHWRENLGDGVYGPGFPLYRGNRDLARFVGTEFVVGTAWQVTRHLTLSGSYSHFFAGQFIRQNGGDDASFVGIWTTFRF
jgi:Alginate export